MQKNRSKYSVAYQREVECKVKVRVYNDMMDIYDHLESQKSVNAYLLNLVEQDVGAKPVPKLPEAERKMRSKEKAKKYSQENHARITIHARYDSDADIIDALDSTDNKIRYIISLIEQDIEASKSTEEHANA